MDKSFEKFYMKVDDSLHDINEISSEYEFNMQNILKYENKMFCPECHAAVLSYTPKSSSHRAYLSKIPSSCHTKVCSYNYEYASKIYVKEFVNKLSSEQIQDRLKSALRFLLKSHVGKLDINDCVKKCDLNPFIITANTKTGLTTYKSLRRKSINSSFKDLEEGLVYLFYGIVKLNNEEIKIGKDKKILRYYLAVYIKNKSNKWVKILKIYRGAKKDLIDSNLIYNIAVLGTYNSQYRNEITTINWNSILITPNI